MKGKEKPLEGVGAGCKRGRGKRRPDQSVKKAKRVALSFVEVQKGREVLSKG